MLLREERSAYWAFFSWALWLASRNKYWVVLFLSKLTDRRSELLIVGDPPG